MFDREVPMPRDHKEKIDRRLLHERVLERLREAIMNGELKPGEFIRQQHIAEQFGVSQMPVREALKKLVAEGLVEDIRYRGVRVVQYTLKDIADLFALRSFLEGRTANAAASLITKAELEQLSTLGNEMESAVASGEIATYRQFNRQFHETIYRASKSYFLIQILDKLWSSYPTMLPGNFPQTVDNPIPFREERDQTEHRAIVAAMAKRDPEAAERLMNAHIQNAGKELVATLSGAEPEGGGSEPNLD
jgi:DNA-binding GntR family transcriptional regulator